MSIGDLRLTTLAGVHIPPSTGHGGWQFRSSSKHKTKRPTSNATSNRALDEPSLNVTLRSGHRNHSPRAARACPIGALRRPDKSDQAAGGLGRTIRFWNPTARAAREGPAIDSAQHREVERGFSPRHFIVSVGVAALAPLALNSFSGPSFSAGFTTVLLFSSTDCSPHWKTANRAGSTQHIATRQARNTSESNDSKAFCC